MPDAAASMSSEAWDKNFSQSIELLKGPSDETRFVGLILVTKLLQGNKRAGALEEVLQALGQKFMNRLLLPLTRQRQDLQAPSSEDTYQQEVMSCGLALAILSSACRIPELAASDDMLDRVPALVKVIKAGGVPSLIAKPAAGPPDAQAHPDLATISAPATVADALDCLVGIASTNQQAQAVLAAGGLEAATKALAASVGSGSSGLGLSGSSSCRKLDSGALFGAAAGSAMPAAISASLVADEDVLAQREPRRVAMLAVRLIAILLQDGGPSRLQVLSDQTDVLAHTVIALGSLIGHTSVLAQLREASTATAVESGQDDAAMLQLEALHTLLLILPLPQELELHQRLGNGMHRQEWPASVRRGLNWLLRSRVTAVQKHSALQLAAALVELAGPGWLLARGEQLPEAFLQVLAETLHVETALLLHDALYPDQLVRDDSGRSESKRQYQAPRVTQPFLRAMKEQALAKETAAAEKIAEAMAAAKLGEDPAEIAAATAAADAAAAAAAAKASAHAADEGEPEDPLSSSGAGAPTAAMTQAAGERASRLLPCCYLLLESIVEVLAEDFAMQEDEMMVIDEAGESDEDEEGGEGNRSLSTSLPQRQGQQLLQPGVSQKAAQQLMYSLESTVAVVLQFMDELQEQGGGGRAAGTGAGTAGAGAGWSTMQADLAVGAVRLLGRFLAEAPDAHTDGFRQALPFMLRVGAAGVSAASGMDSSAGVTSAGPVQFLLPGLLQATSDSSTSSTLLKRAICKSPVALGALASFLEAAAEEAVQLAEQLGPTAFVSSSSMSASGDVPTTAFMRMPSVNRMGSQPIGRALRMAELTRVERLMADASALLLNVVDGKDLGASTLTRRNSGSGHPRSGSSSSSNLVGETSYDGSALGPSPASQQQLQQQQPDWEQLSPLTRLLMPAVSALGRWWRARSGWSSSDAELCLPQQHVEHLAHIRLMPRTMLCCATVCGAVLEAAVKQASLLAAAAAGVAGQPQMQLDLKLGLGSLPHDNVQPVCDLVLQALQAGCCINLTMMGDEDDFAEDLAIKVARATVSAAAAAFSTGSSGSSRSGSGSSTPPSPRSPMHDPMMMAPASSLVGALRIAVPGSGKKASSRQSVGGGPDTSMIVDDFHGDAEHAWERLCQSSVGLVELLLPMVTSARAAGWTQELLDAAAAAGGVQVLEEKVAKKRAGGGSYPAEGTAGAATAVLRQQDLLLQAGGLRQLLATMETQGRGAA